ncbi:RDD family protein [Deltaproteobacteria bacterium OttesenSCG-928-M10]|nr:RDD family protein [Deltaproteobacteria bacterium OttesenSCG-928-M10]
MARTTDRVGELLEGIKRNHREIVSPEGVALDVQVAGHGERIAALALDLFFMMAAIIAIYVLMGFILSRFEGGVTWSVGLTLILFSAFIVRNLYFLHFELAWQGRTPGKKICGLRVINRQGGELTPSAVIARNLTREVEIFLPLSLYFSLGAEGEGWRGLVIFAWALILASLPLWNRDHLRAGDLIGGTQVIAMPKRMLLTDLTTAKGPREAARPKYSFTHDQLAIYGAFELQVLEEFLRRPPSPDSEKLLFDVSEKIRRKIGWQEPLPPGEVRRFLTDFYTAERADLERGQLFGRLRADKTEAAPKRKL